MKKYLLILAAVAATSVTGAIAAPITWTFGNLSEADGHQTYTQGAYTLNVYAYKTANTNGSGLFSSTPLKGWSGSGLGAGTESAPNHSVDNDGQDELIVFDFGNAYYQATSFQFGWTNTDSDADIWVGGSSALAFSSLCFSGCGAGNALTDKGFVKYDFDNAGTSVHNIGGPAGRYLIISAAAGSTNDKFKILAIVGTPPTRVPEPGSIALLMLALFALAVSQRRKLSVR